MSLPVAITFSDPPEGTCPATFRDAVTLLNSLIFGEITGSYLPYVLGFNTPAVEDQNKAWIRVDSVGRPAGTYVFYSGNWRRQYSGKQSEITLFIGNPSFYFDADGRGLLGGDWDGWHLCNGLNGTPNLTDRFIVAAHMDDSDGSTGFSGGWRTKVSGAILASGGAKEVTLTTDQIPRTGADALVVDKWEADGNARSNTGGLYGHHNVSTGVSGTETLIAEDTGNASPDPVPTLPPYLALAYVCFIGYE